MCIVTTLYASAVPGIVSATPAVSCEGKRTTMKRLKFAELDGGVSTTPRPPSVDLQPHGGSVECDTRKGRLVRSRSAVAHGAAAHLFLFDGSLA